MKKLYKYLLYILPLVLIFSYFPVISLGSNETMNFELSLPLLWLVVFDVISLVMVCKKYRKELFTKVFGSVLWWLFPLFALVSVCWSLNVTRGILTVGVMWALFFAVVFLWDLRKNLDDSFWKIFWRWFFGSALFACAWCVVQCILDVSGVSQEASLLCDGCVYQMFGFPHPNGFAIEPQFMGNLLLAPIMVVATIFCQSSSRVAVAHRHGDGALILALPRSVISQIWQKTSGLLLFVFLSTLFLTFSRGAIYACVVGLVVMLIFVRPKLKQIFITLGIFAAAFLFTLNLQGVLTASSPTSDTYVDGVAKVLNHLSLGIIDVRGGEKAPEGSGETTPVEPVENSEAPVENSIYSGYVEESTDTRVRLASAAIEIWHQDFKTALVGVGVGGAGQALYNNGFSPAPKEIVQNEYAEILLETGVIGISLFALIVILAIRVMLKNRKFAGLLIALLAAYGVTLLFFSGLPNALNIVLIPALLVLL
ncbi:O-antigen ligase family protein [Candidatus Saccharibacteria bacterium]|nr:O-antigen ligase family protein [Candidatus Saccharibacteria bacterium]